VLERAGLIAESRLSDLIRIKLEFTRPFKSNNDEKLQRK
jgi:hypothetical protein